MIGRVYFAKRVGWKWEVWQRYKSAPEAGEWRSNSTRYWRRINADREAQSLLIAHRDGLWTAAGHFAPDRHFSAYARMLANET